MWKKIEYTNAQIDKAAELIFNPDLSAEEKNKYFEMIENWRAAHAFPMNTFTINLKQKASDNIGIIVVQRLKRLDTIVKKLQRFPKMKLSRMQDLGGCRVIVPKIADVYIMRERIVKSRIRHKLQNEKDYIKQPNINTGYRGVHLIYKYKSDKNDSYNGLLIEIQIRTKLQHLWATAVETVGTFTQNGLKFNQGSKEWLRFFKLCSALFAVAENTTFPLPLKEKESFLNELLDLIANLGVIDKLNTIAVATHTYERWGMKKSKYDKAGYYLLVLNTEKNILNITHYPSDEKAVNHAIEKYMQIESNKASNIDAVLVSAKSIADLKKAYPNYFADIRLFVNTLFKEIRKQAGLKTKELKK